jgi:7-cyano-7-deazaguanine synthase
MNRAVVLLSGGLDSTVTLARTLEDGYEVFALSFDYGQRHIRELKSASDVAGFYYIREHKVLSIDLSRLGGSALTDPDADIPEMRDTVEMGGNIPITYVPARNLILLAYGVSYAEVVEAEAVFIGANALDYSGYPDCRPEFLEAFQRVADLGTRCGIEGRTVSIRYPLIDMTKADIVKEGIRLSAPLDLTWSCYQGRTKACGRCDSCLLRLKGFNEAGISDPVEYEELGD